MCGRYGRWSRRQRIEELLGIEPSGLDDFPDLYNITPGVETWIARAKDGKPALYSYLWGLVPYWSKDPKKGVRPVNAKAETAHETLMLKKLIRERRCLILGRKTQETRSGWAAFRFSIDGIPRRTWITCPRLSSSLRMPASSQHSLLEHRARPFWLLLGWMLVLLVIYLSLTPAPVTLPIRGETSYRTHSRTSFSCRGLPICTRAFPSAQDLQRDSSR